TPEEAQAPALRVAAVQPDVPSAHRHGPARLDPNLRALLALSRRAVGPGADLLVWPETAWDATAARGGPGFLGVVAHALEVPLLAGVRLPGEGRGLRNAVALADRAGAARLVAEKRHPVPAFESAPRSALARALAQRGLWPGRVAAGPPARPVVLPAGGGALPAAVLVCADLHDAGLVRRLRREGARLLVVLANESHLGPAAADAGLRLARLRAAENRLPVVRVANNGRSAWIDARGRIAAALPARGRDAGGAHLVPAGAAPLHARHGPAPAVALALPFTALLLARGSARGGAPIRGASLLASRRTP
ncbi:MAG: nitrilase-related carbon-nitrogen hydrolase, partial [Myxococcota bacterium]|nr:nitrilase-related carbon-nitrogen hydrolase [Myxococcota bacterium]